MRKAGQLGLVKLAKHAHACLMKGTAIGKKKYKLRKSETWTNDLKDIVKFCGENPVARFPKIGRFQPPKAAVDLKKSKKKIYYQQYFLLYIKNYYWGKRGLQFPKVNTNTDQALGLVYSKLVRKLTRKHLEAAFDSHRKMMVAENAVGQLLERYIYSKQKRKGWIWCAGNTVRFTDFYFPSRKPTRLVLQVKNQANSENSASSTVRQGTETVKWFRRNSKTGATKWLEFPDNDGSLNEESFMKFVESYKFA